MRVRLHSLTIWKELDGRVFDVLDAEQKLWCVELTIDVSRFNLQPELPECVKKQFKVDLVRPDEPDKIKERNRTARSGQRIVIGLVAEPVEGSTYQDAYLEFVEPRVKAYYREIEEREAAKQQPQP